MFSGSNQNVVNQTVKSQRTIVGYETKKVIEKQFVGYEKQLVEYKNKNIYKTYQKYDSRLGFILVNKKIGEERVPVYKDIPVYKNVTVYKNEPVYKNVPVYKNEPVYNKSISLVKMRKEPQQKTFYS